MTDITIDQVWVSDRVRLHFGEVTVEGPVSVADGRRCVRDQRRAVALADADRIELIRRARPTKPGLYVSRATWGGHMSLCTIFEKEARGDIWSSDASGRWEKIRDTSALPDDLVRLDIVEHEPVDVAEAKVPLIDDAMVERMARALHGRTPEGRSGWPWPVNEFTRDRDMEDARRVLARVLGGGS